MFKKSKKMWGVFVNEQVLECFDMESLAKHHAVGYKGLDKWSIEVRPVTVTWEED